MQTNMVRTGCCNAKWVVLAAVLGLLVVVWSSMIVVPAIRGRSIDKFARHLEKDWWRNQAAAQRGLGLTNGLGQTPPMGWNSWNHFNCFIDEDLIIETAEALISTGLAAVGYKYVNIDDCWAELERDSEGNLVPRAATFPSGIRAVADHVHELGLKLGIYSDAGEYTCQKQPGSFGYEEKDAAAFASWEVDYLKYDNCYNDDSLPEVRYPPMRDALNKTGRPIFFSMCEWGVDNPALWAGAVGNSWRTTEDIKDKWSSMVDIIDENDVWADYAGPGGWNDPDMLEVGNGGMSMSEYRTHFSLWALAKAPLLIGCDVRDISPEVLSILSNEEVIAVNQDSLGVQGRKVATSSWWWEWWKRPEVWAGPLSGGRTAVLLWNRAVKAGNVSVKWSDIGLGRESSFEVRDLWAHKTWEGNVKEGIEVHLCGHCSEMFILTPSNAV